MSKKQVRKDFILGILGGMGPMAGVELQKKVISASPADFDQNHIKMVCFTNPQIKDRTKAIRNGQNFSGGIIKSLNLMAKMNVSVGVIACNTAHASFEEIESQIKYPLISIVSETADYLKMKYGSCAKIGILATDGVLQSKVYYNALKRNGFYPVNLNQNNQKQLMEIIYGKKGIKAGYIKENRKAVGDLVKILNKKGAEVVLLGCTELSLLAIQDKRVIDPLDVVANRIISIAYKSAE